jgi:hypothetical protein
MIIVVACGQQCHHVQALVAQLYSLTWLAPAGGLQVITLSIWEHACVAGLRDSCYM